MWSLGQFGGSSSEMTAAGDCPGNSAHFVLTRAAQKNRSCFGPHHPYQPPSSSVPAKKGKLCIGFIGILVLKRRCRITEI